MFNREKPQYIEDSKVRYTLREMKKNASVYVLLAPYFILFTIFTIIPVLLAQESRGLGDVYKRQEQFLFADT